MREMKIQKDLPPLPGGIELEVKRPLVFCVAQHDWDQSIDVHLQTPPYILLFYIYSVCSYIISTIRLEMDSALQLEKLLSFGYRLLDLELLSFLHHLLIIRQRLFINNNNNQLRHLGQETQCEIYAKAEFMNPGKERGKDLLKVIFNSNL